MKNKPNLLSTQNGFTLIEAVVAMAILSIGIFALYSMQLTSIDGNARANYLTTASYWVSDKIEDIILMDYDDLNDGDGDGTNQDTGPFDGVDDDGGDFGLEDVDTLTADGSEVSPDTHYRIFWNVAEDQPMDNLKTVRVHVEYVGGGESKIVSMDFIKPKS